jgi:hypothetical protein
VLNRSKHADWEIKDCGDELKCAFDDDAYEAEGQQDQPNQREEKERGQGKGPAEEGEEAKQKEVEHRVGCLLKIERWVGGKVPPGG